MPTLRLTDKAIRHAEAPDGGRAELWDELVSGLLLRVGTRRKTWQVSYRAHGKRRRLTIGNYPATSLREAREHARKVVEQAAAGEPPEPATTPQRRSFGEVVDEWIKRDQSGNKTAAEARRTISRECGAWWDRPVDTIGRADVLAVLDAAVDRGAATQANRTLAYLRRLFNWCLQRGLVDSSPVANVKAPTREAARDKTLTDSELAAVWRATDRLGFPFGPAVRLLILTAQRRTEAGAMTWPAVDLEAATWTIPAASNKSGRPHVVPLSPPAVDVLRGLPRIQPAAGSPAYVFTTNGRTPASGWSKAKRRLDELSGVTDWRLHDLRRTVATGLVAQGFRPDVVEAALNHANPGGSQLSSVYQRHHYLPEMRAALESWGEHVNRLSEH